MFTTAGQLLGDLAALDSDSALRRRLRYYAPALLVIDEVDYLSYSNRHADLLFELINRRHEQKSMLVTTNKSFSEWSEIFPSAACVVALIDVWFITPKLSPSRANPIGARRPRNVPNSALKTQCKRQKHTMKTYHQPSGLTKGLDVLIDSDWTSEQALAVVELLSDLQDRILAHYQLPILTLMREEHSITEFYELNITDLWGENGLPF